MLDEREDVEITISSARQPSPLDFLRAVYLNEGLPLSVRMRAAIEAAPYCHPKIAVTAHIADTDTFAARLERAIARSGKAPALIEHQTDEG
jgi:hypothetical protein